MDVQLVPMTAQMYHDYFREYQNDPDLSPDPNACAAYTCEPQQVERYIRRRIDLGRKAFAIMCGGEMVGFRLSREEENFKYYSIRREN